MPLRPTVMFLLLWIAVTNCSEPQPAQTVLVRDGLERRHAWKLDQCTMDNGVLVQCRTPSNEPAMAMLLLPPLPDSGSLVVSVRARSSDADSALQVDLWGFGQDDPLQQLSIAPEELTGDFASVSTLWPSGSPDRGIWLRVFTSSTGPIEIDEIDLVHVPFEVARGSNSGR